jgi:hypothetical protein
MDAKSMSDEHVIANEDIDKKIDRLQKQNEAESAALKKLLEGLEKISKPEPEIKNSKKKTGR